MTYVKSDVRCASRRSEWLVLVDRTPLLCVARKIINCALTAVLGALIVCIAYTDGHAQGTLEQARKSGTIRQGIANDAPYGYSGPDGKIIGLEVDVARILMAKIGIPKVEYVVTNFGSLIPGVQANRFDFASDGIYVRAERCQQVLFSNPTLMIGNAAIVRAGNPKNLHSDSDMVKDPTVRVGRTTGGSEFRNFLLAGGKESQLVDFPDRATSIAALKAGRIDVVLGTALGIPGYIATAKDPEIEQALPWKQFEMHGKPMVTYAAYAFRKEDTDLVAAFNAEFATFLKSPQHLEIMKSYGLTADVLPDKSITLSDACK